MRRTLAAVKPTAFGDIIALVSLYRPGPMDNIGMFGDRKNARVQLAYPHPMLEDVLKETYGIFVYQEQVMKAAQVLAGYSLGEADLLRRAMGKKIQSEMNAQRARFVSGAAANDIGPAKASELFDLIDKFAGYGFNKSHAAAYALVAYHTAWLKAHHPPEFFAASMSFDMAQTDKLALFVEDIRRAGVECLPPCVNASRADFSVEDGKVRYALGALKGVGEKAMEVAGRRARRQRPVQEPRRFRRADRPALAQPPPDRKPRRGGRLRLLLARPRRAVCRGRNHPRPRRKRRRAKVERAGRAVRRGQRRRDRPDPPATRRELDAGRADDRRARCLRLLFLGPSDRSAAPSARRAQGPRLRRARFAAGAGRRRPDHVDDGRAGRGSALADLGQGPPLHARDAQRRHRPVRRHRLRRRAERSARGGRQSQPLRASDRRAGPPPRRGRARG